MKPAIVPMWSLVSRGNRYQFMVALAVITIIPMLSLYLLGLTADMPVAESWYKTMAAVAVLLMMAAGYILLAKYPLTIVKLRQQLEQIAAGRIPEKVELLKWQDDVTAIETALNIILQCELQERVRAEQFSTDFVSVVSHELRTPLSITKESIDLLLDHIPGDLNPEQERLLAVARANIDRLAHIITNLLDISELNADQMVLDCRPIDFVELANKAVAPFVPRMHDKALELRMSVPPHSVAVLADAGRLRKVLLILIENAVRFTDQGWIEVAVTESADRVECSVADSGRGIPDLWRSRIFNPFRQYQRAAGAGEKGTGLGLAVAKGVVELHGGRIWFDSHVKVGSRFVFTLPRAVAPDVA